MTRFNSTFFILVVIVALGVSAAGQEDPPTPEPEQPTELEAFIDGLMTAHLEAYESAGASVSVVKGGELVFSKGFGYADVETKKPVEPDKTLFRIGSVSKLFVWTAVMQLVEQGRLESESGRQYLFEGIPGSSGLRGAGDDGSSHDPFARIRGSVYRSFRPRSK